MTDPNTREGVGSVKLSDDQFWALERWIIALITAQARPSFGNPRLADIRETAWVALTGKPTLASKRPTMTETFPLDTSGRVEAVPGSAHHAPAYVWSDLSPFVQGYVGEMFADLRGELTLEIAEALKRLRCAGLQDQAMALRTQCHWSFQAPWPTHCDTMREIGLISVVAKAAGDTVTAPTALGRAAGLNLIAFSDLAPATLEAILRDCKAMQADGPAMPTPEHERDDGACCWQARQFGECPDFPPLTPFLSDVGKIYLREADQ